MTDSMGDLAEHIFQLSSALRVSEWLALGYFAVLTLLSWVRRLPAARRTQATAIGAVMGVVIVWVARHAGAVPRDWAPLLFILIGYYLSGLFFIEPTRRFERWLLAWDHRLLGDPQTRFAG